MNVISKLCVILFSHLLYTGFHNILNFASWPIKAKIFIIWFFMVQARSTKDWKTAIKCKILGFFSCILILVHTLCFPMFYLKTILWCLQIQARLQQNGYVSEKVLWGVSKRGHLGFYNPVPLILYNLKLSFVTWHETKCEIVQHATL